jgi:hypothetical protein
VKNRHQAEVKTLTKVTRNKMKACEKKRRAASKAATPMLDKELLIPLLHPPVLPSLPFSNNHRKAIILSASSGLSILVGFVGLVLFALSDFLSTFFGVFLLGGLVMWFFGGASMVETYLKWQKEIEEYNKQMKEWECEYGKMNLITISEKLMADVVVYENDFFSIVKDCDGIFAALSKEMTEEKNKLAKRHQAELEQLDQEWKDICGQLESFTLIHPDLFYISWRISFALTQRRADTLKEAINIAINDERLDQEEAARQAEARRQEEARRREEDRRYQEEMERRESLERQQRRDEERQRFEEEFQRDLENSMREGRERRAAYEAKKEARDRCHWCTNWKNCGMRTNPPLNCHGFRPSSTHKI